MPVTPLEIRKKEFGRQLRGYSADEVRAFLMTVAGEIEDLRREKGELAEKVEELNARVHAYERTEKLLQDTLLAAQKASSELREAAERDSNSIEREAKVKAERMLLDARKEADHVGEQIRTLVARRAALVHEIAAVARTYLSLAERLEKKPDDVDELTDSAEPAVDPE
jgi:cell division initiation protein